MVIVAVPTPRQVCVMGGWARLWEFAQEMSPL